MPLIPRSTAGGKRACPGLHLQASEGQRPSLSSQKRETHSWRSTHLPSSSVGPRGGALAPHPTHHATWVWPSAQTHTHHATADHRELREGVRSFKTITPQKSEQRLPSLKCDVGDGTLCPKGVRPARGAGALTSSSWCGGVRAPHAAGHSGLRLATAP